MSVNKALDSILANRLDEMRTEFSNALATKAVEKLEERKIEIAQAYFGQVQEEVEELDEASLYGLYGTRVKKNRINEQEATDDPDEMRAREMEKKADAVSKAAGATGIKKNADGSISQSSSGTFKNGSLTSGSNKGSTSSYNNSSGIDSFLKSGSNTGSTKKLNPVNSYNNSSGIDNF